jgi:hypothetical protein
MHIRKPSLRHSFHHGPNMCVGKAKSFLHGNPSIMANMRDPITSYAVDSESQAGRGLPISDEPVDEESLLLPSDREPGSHRQSLWSVMQILKPSSYANILVVFAPLGITSGILHKSPALVFSLNFLAIASLSKLNGRRILQLSAMLGPLPGGILYALFDNAPLLIVSLATEQE